ncbi:hypothetical protein LINPERPRIM_LOCUS30140 [Linum perenne]
MAAVATEQLFSNSALEQSASSYSSATYAQSHSLSSISLGIPIIISSGLG